MAMGFRKRELRGVLARLAWQTVRELMAAAVEEPHLRPGMVSVLQTFGDRIDPHPHVHALVVPPVFTFPRAITRASRPSSSAT